MPFNEFLNVECSGIKYVHIIVQPPSLSISKIFITQTEGLYPLNNVSFLPSPSPEKQVFIL